MKILAIEASAKSASVCLSDSGKICGETFLNCGLTHSVTIMPSVEWLLKMAGLEISDIDKIAITEGPGSFTGLRIGMAAVKGLSWAHELPCVGISTLEAAAFGASHMNATVCAVMDARAGQVYNAIFEAKNGTLTRKTPDRAIKIAELADELINYNNVILTGDGAELCFNAFDGKYALAPEYIRYQRASYVAALAENAEGASAQELSIKYIRLPQAERERLEKLEKEGKNQ